VTAGAPPIFSRSELAGGLPARRATAILFAIESRTARSVVRARRALERYIPERIAAREETAFLAALAEGRDPPLRPSIRDIERHAREWMGLVAPDPSLRAAIAHRLGEKYRFRRGDVPALRAALGLDLPAVEAAHQQLFAAPIAAIYRQQLAPRERFSWGRARLAMRLESLPPFWWAFALTLTETVGAGVLALPIALASLGVVPAVLLLVVFGLVNVLTVAAIVEAIARDGAIRYGSAYLGRLVEDFLGRSGRAVLSVALFAVGVCSTPAYVIGVGSALGSITGSAPIPWIAGLGLITLVVLRRGSLAATVATAIVIGAANVVLLLALAGLALLHLDPSRLTAAPTLAAGSSAALAFGVLLGAYFGHTAAATSAKVVLARDPSGRSLLWGNVAAMVAAIGLYVVVVVGVMGAVPRSALEGFGGTALEPLAAVVGPAAGIIGGAFVVLAMGLATIISCLALYNQTLEVLADRPLADRWIRRSPTARWLLASLPIIAIFVITPLLMANGSATFAGPLALLGTIATPIVGGVFPMLLVLAARRRGELALRAAIPGLGRPASVAAVVALFVGGVLVQGWIVSGDVLARLAAAAVAAVIGGVVIQAVRRGAFRQRAVLELRAGDRADAVAVELVAGGRPLAAAVGHGVTLRQIEADGEPVVVEVPVMGELAVWAHRVTDDGDTVGLALHVTASTALGGRDLGVTDEEGRLTAFLAEGPATITLRHHSEPAR
jgi:amino acid permease